jgi:CopG-like RHH_1 or ribbon-helix-helix domain, RHH_5
MTQRQRVNVTLPEDVHRVLSAWADSEDRTLANLLAHLASKAARERLEQTDSPSSITPISSRSSPSSIKDLRPIGLAAESAGEWRVDESSPKPE